MIASALYEKFRLQPNNVILAMALAAQGDTRAIPLVQSLYAAADPSGKVSAAAALVKLDGPHAQTAFLFLTLGLEPRVGGDTPVLKDFDFENYGQLKDITGTDRSVLREIAFENFGQLKIKAAAPFLKAAIVSYLSAEVSGHSPQPETLARPLDLALAAADSLGKIDDLAAIPLLTKLLRHLRAKPDSDAESIRVTDALLQLNAPRKEINKLMGEQWVQRRIQIRQLKSLPPMLLP